MHKSSWLKARSLALFLACITAGFSASAHQIRMSVYVEGFDLEGEIYFVGGGNPPGSGAKVELKKGDEILRTAIADEEGLFVFKSVEANSYSVRADGGQGHVAYYDVDKSEFPDQEPVADTADTNVAAETQSVNSDVKCSPLTPQELQKAISKAVRPLREKIDRYEAKTRMHDILGGIGYIFGLFGLFMFVRNRKK
ncbi:carboxypeptidase-like regulatory domain-containing protein [Vibrio sp. JC009]|uniref:hypothetical protein n=1 Tax=Vibrio sp. JC009 TaxID=2912314 RepID=UPI0023B1EF5D|nr:hypothetical protein [Vibrio sp. JC009]WED24665.1 carboxypeptidase-like regulatory domain-containing protein [Vibrio sp. JC009]